MIFGFFIVCVLLTYVTGLQKNRDVFSPWRLYIYAHGTVLGVAHLNLHPAMTPLDLITWLVIGGSALAYFSGHIVFNIISETTYENSQPKQKITINWNLILFFVLAYYILYVLVYIWHASQITIPAFSQKKGGTRMAFFGVNYYSMLFLLSFPLNTMASFSYRKFSGEKGIWMTVLRVADWVFIISFLLLLNRNSLLWLILLIMITRHYKIKRFSGKAVIASLFLFICLFYLAAASREGHKLSQFFKNSDLVEVVAKSFYMYPANNVWNLDYNLSPEPIQYIHPTTFGFEHLSPFFDLTRISGKIRKGLSWEDLFMKKTTKVRGYNSVLYQYHLWKEFGWVSVVLIPFAVGFFFCFIYKKMIEERSIFLIWGYGQIAFTILMSFMVPFWYFNIAWFGILMSIIGYHFLSKPLNTTKAI